jgi:hypothetical protein
MDLRAEKCSPFRVLTLPLNADRSEWSHPLIEKELRRLSVGDREKDSHSRSLYRKCIRPNSDKLPALAAGLEEEMAILLENPRRRTSGIRRLQGVGADVSCPPRAV